MLREVTVKIRFERIKRVIVEMLLDDGTTVLWLKAQELELKVKP